MRQRVVDTGNHINDCDLCGHPRREHRGGDDECDTCNVAGGACEADDFDDDEYIDDYDEYGGEG